MEFLADFPMLQIIRLFVLLNYPQNTALSGAQIFVIYGCNMLKFSLPYQYMGLCLCIHAVTLEIEEAHRRILHNPSIGSQSCI